MIEKFGLGHLLERNLDQLSGGELQRVAICATLLKQADVYFFDEPSSYLDIYERMRIVRIISDELNEWSNSERNSYDAGLRSPSVWKEKVVRPMFLQVLRMEISEKMTYTCTKLCCSMLKAPILRATIQQQRRATDMATYRPPGQANV